ncbi:MAG: sulfatase-like hydrolase/transferase, partial [Actinomycetota bacterium]|nr:sulfatase-like hydrolase/transferase [Actinomycetota bacterium]
LPHQPHRFTPEGFVYPGGPHGFTQGGGVKGWRVPEPGVALVQQRHLLQLGYADHLVGRILNRIRTNGDFDRAMIVLTADHGFAFDADKSRRDAAPDNLAGTVNPPLIVKYPGQKKGSISTASTQGIDIVPTITRQLGVDGSYPVAGIPLGEAGDDRVMNISMNGMSRMTATAGEIREQRKRILALQISRLGTGGLWTLGPRPRLIGKRPSGRVNAAGASVRIDNPSRLDRVRPGSGKVPALISATVRGIKPDRTLAIVLNGRIRATARTFIHEGAVRFGAMLPPSKFRRGHNEVSVRVVRRGRLLRVKRLS